MHQAKQQRYCVRAADEALVRTQTTLRFVCTAQLLRFAVKPAGTWEGRLKVRVLIKALEAARHSERAARGRAEGH